MTQSGYPPSPDPGSPGGPDPLSPSPSPAGDQAGWYAPWTPDPGVGEPPASTPEGQPPASEATPDPGAPWGVPGGAGTGAGPGFFGSPPGPGNPGTAPYGQPPYGQPPYGQPQYGQPPYGQPPVGQGPFAQGPFGQGPGPYGPGPFGYGMGYRGWRRGMYGPMAGRPAGPYLRRRAVTHTLLGALMLAIGIVVTVVNLNVVSGGAGFIYVPWFLIVIGAIWFFGGLSMLARTSRFR
ncbi:MAG: hypothetical protein WB802_12785 [Candidatus Dormiibacterota bacterium]